MGELKRSMGETLSTNARHLFFVHLSPLDEARMRWKLGVKSIESTSWRWYGPITTSIVFHLYANRIATVRNSFQFEEWVEEEKGGTLTFISSHENWNAFKSHGARYRACDFWRWNSSLFPISASFVLPNAPRKLFPLLGIVDGINTMERERDKFTFFKRDETIFWVENVWREYSRCEPIQNSLFSVCATFSSV